MIGASNYTADMVKAANETAVIKSLPRYEVLQPRYNLYDRAEFEALRDLVVERGDRHRRSITASPRASSPASIARKADFGKSPRGGGVEKYLDAKGERILAALDQVGQGQ